MQKQIVLAAFAALACSAALAQAPAGNVARPPAEVNPAASGGAAAANAQNKVDTRTSNSSVMPANPVTSGYGKSTPAAEINPSASGGVAANTAGARVDVRLMDTNGDGMVSRKEWDAYHMKSWNSMKPASKGVSTADIDKLNRTSPTN